MEDQTIKTTTYVNNLRSSAGPSGSINSREQGWFEDGGLRTKLTEQPYLHVDDDETDGDPNEDVKVKRARVYTIPNNRTDTPDSVVSTGSRTFFGNGGLSNFDTSNLQNNYDVNKSMRSVVHWINARGKDPTPELHQSTRAEQTMKYPQDVTKKTQSAYFPLKLSALVLVVLALVAALVVIVYFKKDSSSEGQRGNVIPTEIEEEGSVNTKSICGEVTVPLKGIVRFNCSLVEAGVMKDDVDHIQIYPPPYLNKGKPFNITVSAQEAATGWSAYFEVYLNHFILLVKGPAATCSSGGRYNMQLRNGQNETMVDTTVDIFVRSEVLRVNVSLTQDKDNGNSDFNLGCSTNSGCEQSFVDFFAEINQEEQYLRGVNFTCSISYNDYDGYSVSCVGVIPEYLMSQFEKITCRPKSSLLDDLDDDELADLEVEIELPDCDLTKHCGYTCDKAGDYYVVSRERCDIFHRCYERQVFTSYCAPGTFFDPQGSFCACRHTRDLSWCQDNGALKPGFRTNISEMSCT